MVERCSNCGAAFFEGQQFCRSCGAAARAAGEDAPTRLFPQAAPPATTARLDPRGTDPVRDPLPAGYRPPPVASHHTAPLAARGPARGRRGAWPLALVAVAVASVLCTLALVFAFRARQSPVVVIKKGGGEEKGLVPPIPPDLSARVREAVESSGVPLPLDESDAEVTDDETTFKESYPLDPRSSASFKTVHGDITVEGWDQSVAEVEVVKSGGDAGQREATRVLLSKSAEGLSLFAAPAGGDVRVSYHLKLPRGLRQVGVEADRGDVKVDELDGTVVVDVRAGEVEFGELSGAVRGKLIKGNMRVGYGVDSKRGAQEYSVVRGDVTVIFGADPKADLKAETVDGEIELDEHVVPLGVTRTAGGGRRVAGRLTAGGAPLLIKVVNGDIKLKK